MNTCLRPAPHLFGHSDAARFGEVDVVAPKHGCVDRSQVPLGVQQVAERMAPAYAIRVLDALMR